MHEQIPKQEAHQSSSDAILIHCISSLGINVGLCYHMVNIILWLLYVLASVKCYTTRVVGGILEWVCYTKWQFSGKSWVECPSHQWNTKRVIIIPVSEIPGALQCYVSRISHELDKTKISYASSYTHHR